MCSEDRRAIRPSIKPTILTYAVIDLIAAAFTIGSALSGIVGLTIGPYFTLIGGLLAENAQFSVNNTEKDNKPTLGTILADFFDNMEDSLQHLLLNVLGKGDPKALPPNSLTESYDYQNPTAQYFADGKFLVMDVGANMGPAIEKGKSLLVSRCRQRLRMNLIDPYFRSKV